MGVLERHQARAVHALLTDADAAQTLRRYLLREEARLIIPEKRIEALAALAAVCRDGHLRYELTVGSVRARFAMSFATS
jgi:hypothetical protein